MLVLIVAAFFAAPCGCTPPADVEEQVSTLKPLAILYGRYLAQHRGQPPANEAEFRTFVEKEGPSLLEQFAVKDTQALFVSSRDNQPYTVLYGRLAGPPGLGGQPVFAYEKTGVGGKRMVATSLGAVEEVDEARFKELVPTAPSGG
jgi:hypothetical protein